MDAPQTAPLTEQPEKGWRTAAPRASLPEVHRSIQVPKHLSFWRKMLAFSGPGYLVAVGYMDPGNWATDFAGGSRFGFTVLGVGPVLNFVAVLLARLFAQLRLVAGRGFAQACPGHFSEP